MGILGDIFMGLLEGICNFDEWAMKNGSMDSRLSKEEQESRKEALRDSIAQTRESINQYKSER